MGARWIAWWGFAALVGWLWGVAAFAVEERLPVDARIASRQCQLLFASESISHRPQVADVAYGRELVAVSPYQAVSAGRGFEIRVITGADRPAGSLARVRAMTAQMTFFRERFDHLGLPWPGHVHVLLDFRYRPRVLLQGRGFSLVSDTPNLAIFSGISIFDADSPPGGEAFYDARNSPGNQAVFLGFLKPHLHAGDMPEIVAHELGHLTERAESFRSGLWNEARADFIGLALTDRAHFDRLPDYELTYRVGPKESIKLSHNETRRLDRPWVHHTSKVIPNIDAYHINSALLSSALYDVARMRGVSLVLDFISWMDQHERSDDLALTRFGGLDKVALRPKRFVLPDDFRRQRQLIENQMRFVGGKMREWARERALDGARGLDATVEPILNRRGI
jgi:hypothetical protein